MASELPKLSKKRTKYEIITINSKLCNNRNFEGLKRKKKGGREINKENRIDFVLK